MDEQQLQLLYNNYGKNQGFTDYSEFKNLMANKSSRREFFDASKSELGFTDYNEFDSLLKKKDQSSSIGIPPKKALETKTGSSGIQPMRQLTNDTKLFTKENIPKETPTQKLKPLTKENIKTITNPENFVGKVPPKQYRSYGEEIYDKLQTGSADLGASLAAVPELIYDVAAIPQNFIADKFGVEGLATDSEKFKEVVGVQNKIKDFYQERVQELRKNSEEVDKKYQFGVYDSFVNGNYENGFRQLGNSFAESAPATAAIMVGGAYAKAPQLLAATSMTFGAGKNEQLKKENPEMDANTRTTNALVTGLIQGGTETLGSGSIGSAALGLVEREGKDKAFNILKDGLQKYYKEALKSNPLTAAATGEGIEEWASTISENAIDVATGVKPKDYNIFTGGADAFIGGAFAGSVFGGGLYGLDKVVNAIDRKKVKDNAKQTFALQEQLKNPEISDVVRNEIQKNIDGLIGQNQKIIGGGIKKMDALDDVVKNKLSETVSKMDEIKSKAEEIKADANTPDATKKILLSNLKDEYKKLADIKTNVVDGKITAVDALPLKEQDNLKREALKELTTELNPDGTKNITIDNTQITERANKIYKKQQSEINAEPKTEAPQQITAQPKAEVQENIQEKITPTQDVISEEINLEVPKNEGEASRTIADDGNIRIGDNADIQQPEAETVQTATNIGTSEADAKVIPDTVLYHGTPHEFTGFKTNKIGTGEGNQAFGAGLYFTNKKEIAENYANAISSKQKFWNYLQDGNDLNISKEDYDLITQELDNLGFDGYTAENNGLNTINVDGVEQDGAAAYEAIREVFSKNFEKEGADIWDLTPEQHKKLLQLKNKITNPQLYEVEIPIDSNFIEWSTPIKNSEKAKIDSKYFEDGDTGKEIYNAIAKDLGSQQKASEYLLSKGIDGISYKSNNQTGGKDGKGKNYVIFDEKKVTIKKKNEKEIIPTKQGRIAEKVKLADAKIDDVAEKLKAFFPKANINIDDYKTNGLSQDAIIDIVAKIAKSLAKGAIVTQENISEAIRQFKEHFEDDVDEKMVQTKIDSEEKSALKNADIAQKRKELGLEERSEVERKSNTTTEENAKAKIKEGFDTESLIDEILESKTNKALSDEEVVILKQYQLSKENELLILGDKIIEATNQGKGTSLDKLIEQRNVIVDDIDRAYRAGEQSGTITARALQARRIALMNDYSLANMLIQKRKANNNEKLTPEQINEVSAEYAKIQRLNTELNEKIKKLEEENFTLKAGQNIDFLKRQKTRNVKVDEINKSLDDTYASLRKKIREQQGRLSMNAIPVEMIPDIAKLAKLYAQKGVVRLEQIVDNIYFGLQDDIGGLTKADVKEILSNYDFEAEAKEEKRLAGFKARAAKKINELRGKVEQKNFVQPQKTEPVKLDEEAKRLKDELRKAKYEWDKALEKDRLSKRDKLDKAKDVAIDLLNVPRSLMASIDYSAPLRQGLVLTVNNPVIASKAFIEMFRQSFSEKRSDRWLEDLKESPEFETMQKSGLYIADTHNAKLSAKEEQFMSNLVAKVPLVGNLVKGSERAYVGYLNKLRADVFIQNIKAFEGEGMNVDNSEKLYKALGNFINEATGRGGVGNLGDSSAGILSALFFSPRLIASRVRLMTNWANFYWWRDTPQKIRIMYAMNMARTITAGMSLLALLKVSDDDDEIQVELDPRSSDFGKIRVGDKRWDIWGGFQQYARFIAQFTTGERKSTNTKAITKLNGEGYKGDTRADLVTNMLRSKLAPVPATLWNLTEGKNMIGEEYGIKDVPSSFLPLFASDLVKSINKDGVAKGFLQTGLPGAFGVGVQDYGLKSYGNSESQRQGESDSRVLKPIEKLKPLRPINK